MQKTWDRKPEYCSGTRDLSFSYCECAIEYDCRYCGKRYNERDLKEDMKGTPICPNNHKAELPDGFPILPVICEHEAEAWANVIEDIA